MQGSKRKGVHSSPNISGAKKVRPGSKLNPTNLSSKKQSGPSSTEVLSPPIESFFAGNLFEQDTQKKYAEQYVNSEPYAHAVIQPLMDDTLLRMVRKEVLDNVAFTRKETDIYRIHQSGDLANLSGLPKEKLKLFPSLLKLRNVLYSKRFRDYISAVTGCGQLSGKKTDMAINIYTKGCHLLCHDDVIGSRRVSYILYLTDPDDPWQSNWGGGLRLYPTELKDDDKTRVPSPEWNRAIPPAWNQLSLFEVQPGYSFHDVEEVFEEGKTRMAISGWFHIPQEGEEGYIEGEEERLAERSSLQQLQSKSDVYDLPQPKEGRYDENGVVRDDDKNNGEDGDILTEEDCEFLLQYIAPHYLTPDTLEEISERISDDPAAHLENFLSKTFLARVDEYIAARDGKEYNKESKEQLAADGWKVAVPPHKHRYLYIQSDPITPNSERAHKERNDSKDKGKGKGKARDQTNGESKVNNISSSPADNNPLNELVATLLPSPAFQKFLQLATGLKITSYHNLLARCFRRGLDYTLATGWEPEPETGDAEEGSIKENIRVEICLGLTPTEGWDDDVEDVEARKQQGTEGPSRSAANGSSSKSKPPRISGSFPFISRDGDTPSSQLNPGGYEMYMSIDDDDGTSDAAVYKSSGANEETDVMFSMPAMKNTLSIVLRDGGLLRFVKYVSRDANGDRWDVVAAYGAVAEQDDDEEGSDDDEEDEEEGSDVDEDADEDDEEEQDEDSEGDAKMGEPNADGDEGEDDEDGKQWEEWSGIND